MKKIGLVVVVFLSVFLVDGLVAQNMDSSEGDRKALMDLFKSTNGAQWDNKTGWSASSMDLSDNIGVWEWRRSMGNSGWFILICSEGQKTA